MSAAIYLARLRALVLDAEATDGAERRSCYAVLATYSGHILLPRETASLAATCGAAPWSAVCIALSLWVLAWEGAQYARARAAGLSRWAVLRDWWLHDAVAYACGAAITLTAQLGSGPWWRLLVYAVAAVCAVSAACIWGRTREELAA